MHQRGLGLIELLMGLAIAGIVLSLVSPAFAALTRSTYEDEAAKSLVSGLRSARNQALARNQAVVIHAIKGDWSQGWRIILDITGSGQEDSRNVLLVERRNDARVKIVGNHYIPASVRFSHLGQPLHGGFQSGTLHVCAASGPVSRHQVVLASNGRVSLRTEKTELPLCAKPKTSKQRTHT